MGSGEREMRMNVEILLPCEKELTYFLLFCLFMNNAREGNLSVRPMFDSCKTTHKEGCKSVWIFFYKHGS